MSKYNSRLPFAERADFIRAIIKAKGFNIDYIDNDVTLVHEFWDTDIDTMTYNLEMADEE